METRYRITVEHLEGAEDNNEDIALAEGLECTGYLLIANCVRGDETKVNTTMMGISMTEMKNILRDDEPVPMMIRGACALAEADKKALEIHRKIIEKEKGSHAAQYIEDMLRTILNAKDQGGEKDVQGTD